MHSPGTQRAFRLVTTAGFLASICIIAAQAQTQRTTRRIARRDTEDLSRFLIETQQRDVNESIFYDRPTSLDPNRINMATVGSLLDRFAAGTNRLYQQIDSESQYSPRLRSVLSDTLKVRARATLLAQDAQSSRDLSAIARGVRELDSDWRLLSHTIQHIPQPPRSVLDLVAALDRTNLEIEKTFQIEPQIDRRELLTQVMAMGADFDNLIDDITLEMGAAESRDLVRGVRSIRTQAEYAADLIAERGSYKRIVEAYQRAERDWKPIAVKLSQVRSRYIDRSVRRIASSGNALKELLWLENDADISELIATANAMRANVDEFFKRTPLLLMVKLQNPESALRAANHFYDACDVYTDQVQGGADVDTLMEVFKDLEITGQDFLQTFAPMPSQQGQLVLADINRDLRGLQDMASSHYGGGAGFNMLAATDLAAEIETLADHIDYDLRSWLRNRTDANTRAALQLSARFKTNASTLYQTIVTRRPREEIRRQTSDLYEDWRKIAQILRRVPEEDRAHMASISAKLTNAFLDLMLPLGL